MKHEAMILFWWLLFIGVVFFGSLCLAVILRKQWAVHERLVYPLASVAAELKSAAKSKKGSVFLMDRRRT